MDYKEIDNINDRTNLVLLNHIKNKGRRFKKLEKKLSDKYVHHVQRELLWEVTERSLARWISS